MMPNHKKWISGLLLTAGALLFAGCNFGPVQEVTPTVQVLATPTTENTATPTALPTIANPTPQQIIVESPTPPFTPGPPTETETPTETPGPYEYTIQEGDTLYSILPKFGYRDPSIFPLVVSINPNIPSADNLPGPGSTILIPRQTATPIPEGIHITETVSAQLGIVVSGGVSRPENSEIICYTIEDGDTAISIAEAYNTTLQNISALNPDLNWLGCDFNNPSGGPDCSPNLVVGNCIQVPGPTPTPAPTSTPSGFETATPTPTYAAPIAVFPPEGAVAQAGVFRLQWVGVGILQANEVYLVTVHDTTIDRSYQQVTRETSLLLPGSMIPSDGQSHIINWQVSIARLNDNGVYAVISGTGPVHSFEWGSQ